MSTVQIQYLQSTRTSTVVLLYLYCTFTVLVQYVTSVPVLILRLSRTSTGTSVRLKTSRFWTYKISQKKTMAKQEKCFARAVVLLCAYNNYTNRRMLVMSERINSALQPPYSASQPPSIKLSRRLYVLRRRRARMQRILWRQAKKNMKKRKN